MFDLWSIYFMGAIIAIMVLVMSVVFVRKAILRGKEIGIDSAKIKATIKSSAIFSIIPSIPIVIGIGIMMGYLGLAIPWIRLTVIGALQYEILAMDQVHLTTSVITPVLVATAFVIMTISILSGPLFNVIFYKRYQNKLADLQKTNGKLLDTITGSLLGGLLAGLISYMVAGGIFGGKGDYTGDGSIVVNGYVTLLTLATSAIIMGLCGITIKLFKWKWMENYALPITILGSIGLAFLYINLFGGVA